MVTWNASDYHRHSAAQQAWARELIDKLKLKENERVLDVGCGDGKITAQIARLVTSGKVTGVDKSEEMIAFAKEAFPPVIWPNLSYTVMDAEELAFDAEFDAVFSNATLHWIKDHQPVLRGIAHALRPGGRCLLQMGGRGNAAEFIEMIFTSDEIQEHWGQYFTSMQFPYGFYGPEEYIPWLTEAGLTPLRVELLPRDMAQHGAEGLAGWMRTTWMPYTHRIPEDMREQFVLEAVDCYLSRYPLDHDGMAHVAMMRLEVEAIRLR